MHNKSVSCVSSAFGFHRPLAIKMAKESQSSWVYHFWGIKKDAAKLEENSRKLSENVIAEANNEIDAVAVYGGGSILMKEFLRPRLEAYCRRARIQLIYIEDPTEAVFLEAEGLNAFLNSGLFQYLKEHAA